MRITTLFLLAALYLAACGGAKDDEFCRYDLRSPPAEAGAACQPEHGTRQPCIGSGDGITRECWFVCPIGTPATAASGCTPTASCTPYEPSPTTMQVCLFDCPMANPRCL